MDKSDFKIDSADFTNENSILNMTISGAHTSLKVSIKLKADLSGQF